MTIDDKKALKIVKFRAILHWNDKSMTPVLDAGVFWG